MSLLDEDPSTPPRPFRVSVYTLDGRRCRLKKVFDGGADAVTDPSTLFDLQKEIRDELKVPISLQQIVIGFEQVARSCELRAEGSMFRDILTAREKQKNNEKLMRKMQLASAGEEHNTRTLIFGQYLQQIEKESGITNATDRCVLQYGNRDRLGTKLRELLKLHLDEDVFEYGEEPDEEDDSTTDMLFFPVHLVKTTRSINDWRIMYVEACRAAAGGREWELLELLREGCPVNWSTNWDIAERLLDEEILRKNLNETERGHCGDYIADGGVDLSPPNSPIIRNPLDPYSPSPAIAAVESEAVTATSEKKEIYRRDVEDTIFLAQDEAEEKLTETQIKELGSVRQLRQDLIKHLMQGARILSCDTKAGLTEENTTEGLIQLKSKKKRTRGKGDGKEGDSASKSKSKEKSEKKLDKKRRKLEAKGAVAKKTNKFNFTTGKCEDSDSSSSDSDSDSDVDHLAELPADDPWLPMQLHQFLRDPIITGGSRNGAGLRRGGAGEGENDNDQEDEIPLPADDQDRSHNLHTDNIDGIKSMPTRGLTPLLLAKCNSLETACKELALMGAKLFDGRIASEYSKKCMLDDLTALQAARKLVEEAGYTVTDMNQDDNVTVTDNATTFTQVASKFGQWVSEGMKSLRNSIQGTAAEEVTAPPQESDSPSLSSLSFLIFDASLNTACLYLPQPLFAIVVMKPLTLFSQILGLTGLGEKMPMVQSSLATGLQRISLKAESGFKVERQSSHLTDGKSVELTNTTVGNRWPIANSPRDLDKRSTIESESAGGVTNGTKTTVDTASSSSGAVAACSSNATAEDVEFEIPESQLSRRQIFLSRTTPASEEQVKTACKRADFIALVKFLCGQEPKPQTTDSEGNIKPAESGNELIAKLLNGKLTLGRSEGIADTTSGAILHACCNWSRDIWYPGGAMVLCELLVSKAANIDVGDAEGDSPLAHARYFRAGSIYKILRESGGELKGPFFRTF